MDDGSADGTAEIATSFVARHPSWTLIWQANAGPGPGAGRNRGLMEVKSDYVLFCDGDDMLEPQALERLVDAAAATSADIVVGASRQFPSSRRWRWSHLFEPLDDVCRAGSVNGYPDLVHHPAPGDKLFRTAYLRESGLRFWRAHSPPGHPRQHSGSPPWGPRHGPNAARSSSTVVAGMAAASWTATTRANRTPGTTCS